MFGFQGGESAETAQRKKIYMNDAQNRWRFLTNLDCSTVKTEGQLVSLVKVRSATSEEKARQDVQDWMEGKTF